MAKNNKKPTNQDKRDFDEGTHPGAYVANRDLDSDRIEFFNLVDKMDFIDLESRKNLEKFERAECKPANQASPPASDPPVPNRAHTEM